MSKKIELKGPVSRLLLNSEQKSLSFDETELTINKKRRLNIDNTKATRLQSLNNIPKSRSKSNLQTERLVHITTLDRDNQHLNDMNKIIAKSKRIIVLTGAGISCNAGIPDFRSANGLYNLVREEYPDLNITSGKEMFDISLFRDELKIAVWATFMEKLYSSIRSAKPTTTHRFIAHLKNRQKLLRCYTQNIDGLEESLGLETSCKQDHLHLDLDKVIKLSQLNNSHNNDNSNMKTVPSGNSFNSMWKSYDVVQLHGDLNSLSCTKCFHVFEWSRSWVRTFKRGELPGCPRCESVQLKRTQQGKRLISNTGLLRPNIVLYGENHPAGELISKGINFDMSKGKPDLFIIMGTSLKVDGVKRLVRQISSHVHERGGLVLLINKTTIGDSNWHGIIDYQIQDDCDNWVQYLEDAIPNFFKSQRQVDRERALKREASELRKKKVSASKKAKEAKTINTPPTTPERDIVETSEETNANENETRDLNIAKRQLIPTDDTVDDDNTNTKKIVKV